MRRVAIITGTRAEYGILKPLIECARDSTALELQLIATGMHLSPDHGMTVNEIEADGFSIAAKVEMLLPEDSAMAMGKSMARGISGLIDALDALRPDIVVVLGDRIEAMAGATAGLFCGAALAHLHGGEITQGGLDEYMRHAITKLSHLHFAATPKSRERIIAMGENPASVFHTGSPAIDALLRFPSYTREQLRDAVGSAIPERYGLAVQHPISTHPDTARREMQETLAALKESGVPCFLIYPNADAGNQQAIEAIKESEQEGWLATFLNLRREVYCNLMRHAAFLAGNSSSGMIDAPSFGIPVINIGERQAGRERGENVIDAAPERNAILSAVKRALHDDEWIAHCKRSQNPYGDGAATPRIMNVLESVDVDRIKEQKMF